MRLENERLKLEQLEKERKQALETQNTSQLDEIEEEYEKNLDTYQFFQNNTTVEALLSSDQFQEKQKQKKQTQKKSKKFDLSVSNKEYTNKLPTPNKHNNSCQVYPTFSSETDSKNIMNMSKSMSVSKNKKKQSNYRLFSKYIMQKTNIQQKGILSRKQTLTNILNSGLPTIKERQELKLATQNSKRRSVVYNQPPDVSVGTNDKFQKRNSIFMPSSHKRNLSQQNSNTNNNYNKKNNTQNNLDQNIDTDNNLIITSTESSKKSQHSQYYYNQKFKTEGEALSDEEEKKDYEDDNDEKDESNKYKNNSDDQNSDNVSIDYFNEIGDTMGVDMQASKQITIKDLNNNFNSQKSIQSQEPQKIFDFNVNTINNSHRSYNLNNNHDS